MPSSLLKPVSIAACLALIEREYNLTHIELLSARRSRWVARPRQIVMWLARHATTRSLPEIGRHLGDRDHTTIMHGVRTIDHLRNSDPEMRAYTDWALQQLISKSAQRDG